MMYQPKQDLYELLQTVTPRVYQNRPEVLSDFPCITFMVVDNRVNINLDKVIAYQEMVFNIDLWSRTSTENSSLLSSLEEVMRENGYILRFSSDTVDPDGISHITTRFNFVN